MQETSLHDTTESWKKSQGRRTHQLLSWLVVAALVAIGPQPARGASSSRIFYIDYTSGADTNNGTSKTTPWQHAPGMVGCTGTCASTTPQSGDRFILKGGVTWSNVTMRWNWKWGGDASNIVYVGVDQTWFSGDSWSRPVLDGGGETITGGGGLNVFLWITANYVTIDNIELKGAYFPSGVPYGGNAFINPQASKYVTIKHSYFHGWSNPAGADRGTGIISSSALPSVNVGMVIAYNIFDGSDTPEVQADPQCTGACQGTLNAIWYGPIVHHNIIRYVSNGYIGAAESFHDNLVEYTRRSPELGHHENAFKNNSDPCTGLLFYNNLIRHAVPGVTVWMAPQKGCATTYAWNNVLYNTTAGNVFNVANALTNPGGSIAIYNNTMQCGPQSNPSYICIALAESLSNAIIENNHLITSNPTPIQTNGAPNTQSHQIIQTLADANNQGYTALQSYATTSGNTATVGTGFNLTSSCSGSLPTLCSDTGLAGTRTPNPRPTSGAWNAGAYELTSALPRPLPPQYLRLVR